MKIKKIIGTVFIAVLIVFSFTGTAAADEVNLGTVSVYKLYNSTTPPFDLGSLNDFTLKGSIWRNDLGGEVVFIEDNDRFCIAAEGLTETVYTCAVNGKTYKFTLQYPTAPVTGLIYDDDDNPVSQLIGSTVDTGKSIGLTIPGGADGLMFTNPSKTLKSKSLTDFGASGTYAKYDIEELDAGEWTVQAVFNKGTETTYTKLAPGNEILGKEYHFTIVKADTGKKLTASAEEVTQGGYVSVTLSAPYQTESYKIEVENGEIPKNQSGVSNAVYDSSAKIGKADITVNSAGKAEFSVQATGLSDMIIKLMKENSEEKSVTVSVKPGLVTANAKKNAYYLGDKVKLSGTNDFGGKVHFYVKGTNFEFTYTKTSEPGKEWETSIKTSGLEDKNGKKPDAGTYSFYAVKLKDDNIANSISRDDLDNLDKCLAYTVVSVDLMQQIIRLDSASEITAQGSEFKAEGTAEGTLKEVQYYVFGTNYFNSDYRTVSNGKFTVKLTGDVTNAMQPGQYFMVIQHPMYDEKFNVGAGRDPDENLTGKILVNNSGKFSGGTVIFDTSSRQSANAAEALCQAIDSEDIDDMYVKVSFVIADKNSQINPIPTSISKGGILTISGTAYGYKYKMVTAEILSTAFTAASKHNADSASFISASEMIDENGNWEISFDTSKLDMDMYTVSVSVADLDAAVSKITITAPAEKKSADEKQDVPAVIPTANPVKPTETPVSPGFGIAAVFAAAAAVLLIRRGGDIL